MRSTIPAKLLVIFAVVASVALRCGAEAVFQDGFEECGAGRWSAGDPSPLAEQLSALTPIGLAAALGACSPSLIAASFRLADGSSPSSIPLAEMSDQQSAILHAFGTGGMVPTAGGAMIALSSGRARDADQLGYIAPEPGATYARSTAGPPTFIAAHGGVFPGHDTCPDGPDSAYDSVGLRLTFTVPPGATRLALDWRFVSSDFPDSVCTSFVDFFLGIVSSGTSLSLPADRNVVVDSVGRPISADSVDMVICNGCSGGTAALAGTGYPADDASATEWRTAFVPVVGGETLVLDLVALDVGDGSTDNIALLDGMRWLAD